jgi:hypothetical protein
LILTDSLESYQQGASKETLILRKNGRVPTKEIVIHFLKEHTATEISKYRTKIFRYLKEHGLVAVANIELTRGKDYRPNNKVHSHCLTDDRRSKRELSKLFNTACEQQGLIRGKDFRIDYRKLYDGYSYFDYFTKYGYSDKVILFQKGIRIQKFYQIGRWFSKTKKQIWEEIKAYMREKYGTDPDRTDSNDDIDTSRIDDNNEYEWKSTNDEVPFEFGAYTDLDRVALFEECDIDLDKFADESISTNGFYVPGVGMFRKFSNGLWACLDNDEMSSKPTIPVVDAEIGKDNSNDGRTPLGEVRSISEVVELPEGVEDTPQDRIKDRIPQLGSDCPSDGYYLPQDRIRDRRHEWKQRYGYYIAFLN